MHRTIQEIRAEIDERAAQEPDLQELNSPSQTRLFNILADIFAFAAWSLEQMHRYFSKDIDNKLLIPSHNARWYRQQALQYQHGDELIWNEDTMRFAYLQQNNERQIIAQTAATEMKGGVLIKAVKQQGEQLKPLSEDEFAGFSAYMQRIKDAGVRVITRSWMPDDLRIKYNIFYDPLVLNSDGKLLGDTSKEPVKQAIENYVKYLAFNARFRISELEDAIQQAAGVVDLQKLSVQSRNGTYDFTDIDVSRIAEAGYMKLTDDSTINYKTEFDV